MVCANITQQRFTNVGIYNIPSIFSDNYADSQFIGFNYAKTCKETSGKGVHFFLDDYQFERIWNSPSNYEKILKRFDCVLSPDFSLYRDMPTAVMIYNHFRKHWLAASWQAAGVTVIPTISWADRDSYSWCFDGEPTHSTVAVSSVGTQKSKAEQKLFLDGYNEMMERLTPAKILFFGKVPDGVEGNIIKIPAFQDKFREGK